MSTVSPLRSERRSANVAGIMSALFHTHFLYLLKEKAAGHHKADLATIHHGPGKSPTHKTHENVTLNRIH